MQSGPTTITERQRQIERDRSVHTGNNASRNNVPNKRLLVGTFLCAVLGTLRSTFCVPDTVLDILFVILLSPGICIEIEIDLNLLNAGN
jgi:hypothetical protein